MINKIIHYCWFGGKQKPRSVRKCMETWKRHLPDYQLMEWNEDNFDINALPYVQAAYTHKKYAFVSDYVRLYALYNFGGIYFDTDIEVLKSFDDLLDAPAFIGYESPNCLGTAVIAAEKGNPVIKEFLDFYVDHVFDENDKTANSHIISRMLSEKGVNLNNQFLNFRDELYLYPLDYFIVKTYYDFQIHLSENSYSIHHCAATWLPWSLRIKWNLLSRVGSRGQKLYFFLHRLKSSIAGKK